MTDAITLREKLEATLGPVFHSDLVAHLRRSAVFLVGPELALVDAALAVAVDDTASVAQFLASGALRRPTDDEQRVWAESPGRTWIAIVVQPFVLIADPTD